MIGYRGGRRIAQYSACSPPLATQAFFLGTIRSDFLGNTILTHLWHRTLPLYLAFTSYHRIFYHFVEIPFQPIFALAFVIASCHRIPPLPFCHFLRSLISIHLTITEQPLEGQWTLVLNPVLKFGWLEVWLV